MAQLVDIVFHPPASPGLAHEIGTNFSGDDFIGTAVFTVGQNTPVVIDDHPLAHTVEGSVRAAHAYVGGDHQVTERVGPVGEPPAVPNRRGIARRSDHKLRTPIGGLPGHFGKHTVVAYNQGKLHPRRSFDNGDSQVSRFPGFNRHPGMKFAIAELHLAAGVDDDSGIPGIPLRIPFHNGEASPHGVVDAGSAKRRNLRAVHGAHDFRVGIHREAVECVLRKHHQIHRRHVPPRLGRHRNDLLCLPFKVCRCFHHRQLELHHPDHQSIR